MKVFWKKVSEEKWIIATEPCAVLCELYLLATNFEARCLGRKQSINETTWEAAKHRAQVWFRNQIRELAIELEAGKP